ncbi:hypothetical protein QJQ45_014957 [Haematococcus lacustris]|nr:hypothetical protein QJQ45_014957 [Haematococcus lacustris]
MAPSDRARLASIAVSIAVACCKPSTDATARKMQAQCLLLALRQVCERLRERASECPANERLRAVRCTGVTLQSACSAEIAGATAAFSINTDPTAAGRISQADIDKYLTTSKPPSPACCSASCAFNSNLCSCDANMLSLVASFTGGSVELYNKVVATFAQACKFTPYAGPTCPPKTPAPATPFGTKCPA